MSLMAAIRKLWHSIAPRTHSDVEEEFRSTLDAYQEDLIRQGLSAEEARRKARIDLGRPSAQNETYRSAIGLRVFDELSGDIRYGLRGLRRNPGFATVAIITLALGIGATTAIFSFVNAVLLKPLPYPDPERIVSVSEQLPGGDSNLISTLNFLDWERQNRCFQFLSAIAGDTVTLTGSGIPEELNVHRVSASYFKVLGVGDAGTHLCRKRKRGWQRSGSSALGPHLAEPVWRRPQSCRQRYHVGFEKLQDHRRSSGGRF
jgi:hypothetical protein